MAETFLDLARRVRGLLDEKRQAEPGLKIVN